MSRVPSDPDFTFLVGATAPPGSPANIAWSASREPALSAGSLLRLARNHDVVLQCARACAGAEGEFSASLMPFLAPLARQLTIRALRLAGELTVLARRFADAGIPAIVLKGAALSQEIFGNPAMRDPGDIDLLIRDADLRAADRLMTCAGYIRETGWDQDFADGELMRPLRRIFHISYHDSSKDISVELHWRWFHIEEVMPFDPAMIWRGTRQMPIGDAMVTVLSPAVQLVYLSFHAAKHECERLKWVGDLAWLLFRLEDAVIADAVVMARRLGILDLFLAPFLAAARLGMATLPPSLSMVADRRPARRLAEIFLAGLEHPPPREHIGTLRQRLHWQRTYWRLAAYRRRPVRLALMRWWARAHLG
jgi:hypothetical protein